jgi:hypothetical protein
MVRVKKRHGFLFVIIVLLVGWIIISGMLPVGFGDWNGLQIEKIKSQKSSDNFCFAVMGDNQDGFRTFHRIINDVNNRKPLFAIDNGDLVSAGSKEKYRMFYDDIQSFQVPLLVSIGNHDILRKGRANYYDIFGDFYYSFSYNDSLFIVLDDANEKRIDEQQMNFLETELKRDFKNKFVFMHVPAFDPRQRAFNPAKLMPKRIRFRSSLLNESGEKVINMMSKYNVTTVFSGHIHGYFNESMKGVNYIITGGAGGELFYSDPTHYFYNYVYACVNGSNVSYEVIPFPSPDNNPIDRFFYAFWIFMLYFIITNRVMITLVILILVLIADLIYIEYWRK